VEKLWTRLGELVWSAWHQAAGVPGEVGGA
jgi:hypothetical protein